MAATPFELSVTNVNPKMVRKRKPSTSSNLFNNLQRNHSTSSTAPLPIITLSSFSNFEEKLIRMATNNKSAAPSELPPTQTKSSVPSSNRSNPSSTKKSPLNYSSTVSRPTTSQRSNNQQHNDRNLFVTNAPMSSHRAPNNSFNHSPRTNQPALSHRDSQYGHFLAYLRRQTLARLRRKQQEQEKEEGRVDNIETTMTTNSNKQPYQSASNHSLIGDSPSVTNISITSKRTGQSLSTYQPLQRSSTNYHLSQIQNSPLTLSRTSTDDHLQTPANSVVDDATLAPVKPPYEVNLNAYKLDYCYTSDDSGVKYQGQMLSSFD